MRVVRVIGRLNIGGPAIQAINLAKRLEPLGYETTLVRGLEGPREGSMDELAATLGVRSRLLPTLRRNLGPHDLRALASLTLTLRRARADVLHTHQAKAGTLGRLAALLAGSNAPPVRVHTFHGHVLTGYFRPRQAALFSGIERGLARTTTRLVAVSDEVRDDLCRLGVAPRSRIEVIPLGFDLSAFTLTREELARRRAATRRRMGISQDARVVGLVARLVPIKRVDRFLRVARRLADLSDVQFLIVGDGELREELQSSAPARALGGRVSWVGFQSDMPGVMSACDVVALSSDNEGTPVSLIEAQATGLPVVSTAVGGVASAVVDDRSGHLVAADDEAEFAAAVRDLLLDRGKAETFGRRGRQHVLERFRIERLVQDVDVLYRQLLQEGPR